jgi:hypothetical protein
MAMTIEIIRCGAGASSGGSAHKKETWTRAEVAPKALDLLTMEL